MDKKKESILIIGKDLQDYSRKWVFIEGFRKNFQVEVVDLERGPRLWLRFLKEVLKRGAKKDYLMVMQVAQEFVWPLFFYRLVSFFRQKIIVDTHISLYDTFVNDRKLANRFSLKGFYYYFVDFLTCRLGDILIFDTDSHRDYFVRAFKLSPRAKKFVLPVCVNLEEIQRRGLAHSSKTCLLNDKFNIVFWGYYIPLQGIEYILEAASLLKDEPKIFFTLIGNGQTRKKMEDLKEKLKLDNVEMVPSVEYEDLFEYIFDADVCLGIFGNTEKARRVIPNKLVEAMACGKIVVTGRNVEMEKYFKDREDLLYCEMANARDLAEKIKEIYGNYENFKLLEENAVKAIRQDFSLRALEGKVKKVFELNHD